jgi:hypothetical protein
MRADQEFSRSLGKRFSQDRPSSLFATAAKVLRPHGRLVTLDCAYVKGQHPVARLLLALDRGRHIRTPEAYLSIARQHFREVNATVLHDLIALPYTHCIIEARAPLIVNCDGRASAQMARSSRGDGI